MTIAAPSHFSSGKGPFKVKKQAFKAGWFSHQEHIVLPQPVHLSQRCSSVGENKPKTSWGDCTSAAPPALALLFPCRYPIPCRARRSSGGRAQPCRAKVSVSTAGSLVLPLPAACDPPRPPARSRPGRKQVG